MKFGILKSKIDTLMNESYKNNSFKNELKTFDKLILKNKNIGKLFYLYDELTTHKGLNEGVVNDYMDECINQYKKVIKTIKPSDIEKLNEWVKNVKVGNKYVEVDNLFSNNIIDIEGRIKSKNFIKESLMKVDVKYESDVNLPISTMIKIANQTFNKYYNSLTETDKKELGELLIKEDSELIDDYKIIKESVIGKLVELKKEESNSDTFETINETIKKIESEKFDKLNYYKLRKLNDEI